MAGHGAGVVSSHLGKGPPVFNCLDFVWGQNSGHSEAILNNEETVSW